jgi:carbon-monoxide dehydrogenase catalytic subunit
MADKKLRDKRGSGQKPAAGADEGKRLSTVRQDASESGPGGVEEERLTVCRATEEMLAVTRAAGIETVFERAAAMKPCPIGAEGSCCKNCSMGPCRVPPSKKEGEPQKVGLCGATAETIAARNFARMVAAGSAAHSDHGRALPM